MEIKRGSYILKSDPYCCWIEKVHEVTQGKNKGSLTTTNVSGYYPTFTSLAEGFASKELKKSDAKSMVRLCEEVKKIEQQLARQTESWLDVESQREKGKKK